MQCSAAVKAGRRPRAQRGRERRAVAAERASACGVRARATSGAGGAAGFTQLTIGGRTCSGRSRAADFCERDPVGHTRRLLHEGNAGVRGRGAARLAGATHRASRVPVVRPTRRPPCAHHHASLCAVIDDGTSRAHGTDVHGSGHALRAAARRVTAGGCACQQSLRLRAAYSTPRTVRNSWPLRIDARAGYGTSGGGWPRDDQPRRAARRKRGGD